MFRWLWIGVSVVLVFAMPLVAQESGESVQEVGGGRSPSLSFCQERFYDEDDGIIRCNWAVNFTVACFVSYPNNKVIQAGSKLAEPEVVGECDNGEKIVKLRHY